MIFVIIVKVELKYFITLVIFRGSYVIQLTIDSDINVPCGMNSVYVYDGLPNFVSMSRTHPAHSLGVFCTRDSQYPLTIEGITGKHTHKII